MSRGKKSVDSGTRREVGAVGEAGGSLGNRVALSVELRFSSGGFSIRLGLGWVSFQWSKLQM